MRWFDRLLPGRSPHRETTLRSLLVTHFTIATLLPLILFAALSYSLVTESMKQRITADNRLTALTISREIDATLKDAQRNVLWIADMTEETGMRAKRFSAFFNDSLYYLTYLEQLIAADAQGDIFGTVPDSPDRMGTSVANRSYFRRTRQAKGAYWSGIFFSSLSHSNSVVCAVPLGEGVLAAHINLGWLNAIADEIGRTGKRQILITDRNGTVIAYRNHELVERKRNISSLPPVQEALAGREGTFDLHFRGSRYLCYAMQVDITDWPLLVLRPYEDAFSIQRDAGLVLAAVVVISLVMGILLSYLMGNRILAPLDRLASTARTIAQGNYSVTPPAGFREMRAVSDALHFMTREIEEREEALQSSLYEKDTLLMEIHHRVKNNLQLIMSLLSLKYTTITDPAQRSSMNDTINHIYSIAQVHEQLYQNRDVTNIDLHLYVDNLVSHMLGSYVETPGRITAENDTGSLRLSLDSAIPCGLILSELISNSLQHAFSPDERGRITVEGRRVDGQVHLTYRDSGPGFPPQLFEEGRSMGFQIIHVLTEQLSGSISYRRYPDNRFTLTFPG